MNFLVRELHLHLGEKEACGQGGDAEGTSGRGPSRGRPWSILSQGSHCCTLPPAPQILQQVPRGPSLSPCWPFRGLGSTLAGRVKAQCFAWESEPVKVTGTAWRQLVRLAARRVLALGTALQGSALSTLLPAAAQAGLGCGQPGAGGVWDGHLTVQVQVQGLKGNSQQLVLDD